MLSEDRFFVTHSCADQPCGRTDYCVAEVASLLGIAQRSLTPQNLKCLNGEHEARMQECEFNLVSRSRTVQILPFSEIRVEAGYSHSGELAASRRVAECRHCRTLYAEKP